MACKIVFDQNGNKIGVEENNELFQQILSNPHVKTFDEAIQIFKQTYSDEIGLNNVEETEAQEYFTREADRLPLTLAVFQRPEFKDLQGRQVNKQTVLNYLNQSGIKQIEKDLIKNVIEQNYRGQKETVNPALKDVEKNSDIETPILENPAELIQKGLPTLEIIKSTENFEALESEIGGDKGLIDESIRYIPIQEYDVILNKRSKQIAEQIQSNEYIEPLIVAYDKSGNVYIVEGQHRAGALKELGYEKAPVVVIYDKTKLPQKTESNKISYDELEATVRANIMPLERIFTSSYADYGMDNLGNGNYGEANTIILNAPIEHGVTGHFSGDFKASGRKNIKYVAKQLNDNTWVAVEEGYESQANNNNIYQFVGTAGTKEAVDTWIENYENPVRTFNKTNTKIVRDTMNGEETVILIDSKNSPMFTFNANEFDENQDLHKQVLDKYNGMYSYPEVINKGMFAHMRVWQDGDIFYVAEAQSDYFQKNNARKGLLKVNDILFSKEYADFFLKISEKRLLENESKVEVRQNEAKTQWRVWLGDKSYGVYETKEEAEKNKSILGERLVNESVEDSVIEKDPEIVKYLNKKLDEQFNKLSPQEKQFIASQKEWEKRLLREALKEASLSGATTFRLPTPYTLSVIEGYVSSEGNKVPYNRVEIQNGSEYVVPSAVTDSDLKVGEVIYIGEEPYYIIKADISTIEVAPKKAIDNRVVNRQTISNKLKGTLEEGELLDTVIDSYFKMNKDVRIRENALDVINKLEDGELSGITESFGQPKSYNTKNNKENFQISDLSDTQQTVARKYEELYNLLQQERGAENVETVTDENGFDWYETKISEEEKNNPVVAFQIIGGKGASRIQEYQNLLNQAKELEKEGKDYSSTGWYKSEDGWKFLSKEVVENFKIINSTENTILTLKEVIGNENQIFKIYPEMDKLKVVFYNKFAENIQNVKPIGEDSIGDFTSEDSTITINVYYSGVRQSLEKMQYTLGHEVSHYGARIEGFSKGGNLQSIIQESAKILNIDITNKNAVELYQEILKADKTNLTERESKIVNDSFKTAEAIIKNDRVFLYNQYKHILGEIDANIVAQAVFNNKVTGTYGDLLAMYVNDNNIDVNSIYIIDQDNVEFRLAKEKNPITLKYKVGDNIFTNYSEALQNSDKTSDIQAGVNTVDGFKELFSVSPSLSVSNFNGFVNNLIDSNILSGESYLENGIKHLKPQGKTSQARQINAEIAKDLLQKELGLKAIKMHKDNSITFDKSQMRENVIINGKTVKLTDLKNKTLKQLKSEFGLENTVNILANEEFKTVTNAVKTKNTEIKIVPENELQQKVLDLLKRSGIKTLALDEYIRKTKNRNIPTDANALADLTNKIIAFKDGVVEEDTLLEEVAHLIEASIPLEQKENVLRNIHKTKEWGEFAKIYSEIYETEAEVRTEILGKVIANALRENFQSRGKNQTEDSIINKIKEFVTEFFDRVRAFFSADATFQQDLDNLNKDIYNKLMSETLNLSEMKSKGVFFSVADSSPKANKIYQTATSLLERIEDQVRLLSKNSADRAQLEKSKELIQAENISGIASLVRLTSSQVNAIKKSAEKAKEGDYPLSPEENIVYKHLKDKVIPSLAEIKTYLDTKNSDIAKEIEAEIDTINLEFSKITGNVASLRQKSLDRMLLNLKERYSMSGKEFEEFEPLWNKAVSGVQADTDFFHAHLGSLLVARNPLLNVAGNIIERMNIKSKEYHQAPTKKLVDALVNLNKKDFDSVFDKDNFIRHEISQEKVEQENERERVKIINAFVNNTQKFEDKFRQEILNTKDITDEERAKRLENLKKNSIEVTESKEYMERNKENHSFQKFYAKRWKDFNRNNYETYFKKEFIDDLNNAEVVVNGKLLKRREVYPNALEMNDYYKAQSTQIQIEASEDGLTKAQQVELQNISKAKFEEMNPRSPITGELLPGIKEIYDENLERYIVEFSELDENDEPINLTDEQRDTAQIIVGMNQISYIDQKFFENKKKDLADKFVEDLKSKKTVEEKLDFLSANARISFPEKFYDLFDRNKSLTTKLRNEGSQEALDLEKQIREQQAIVKRLLRINSVYNAPGETNFMEMNKVHLESIKLAESRKEKLYQQARTLLGDKVEIADEELGYDNTVNDAYLNYLADSGLDELSFILENVTDDNKLKILEAKKIANEETDRISKSMQRYFSPEMTKEEKQAQLIEYGRSKLLPYLKKTEPVGYSEAMQQVRNGELAVEDFIQMKDLIKVSPSISYYEKTDPNVNPKWLENRNNKREQWTEDYIKRVKDDVYFNMFDFKDGQPTKNKNIWEARQALLEYSDLMIEYQGLTGKRSRYLKPQVRSTDMERYYRLNATAVKQTIKDFTEYRAEEQELGATTSDGLYTIPKYYNTPLEDKTDVTDNHLWSYILWGEKASEYKSRREHIADMFIIEDVLNDSNNSNKRSDSKNTVKMFKNFMEYNFYGVRENFSLEMSVAGRKVDVGKVLTSMNKWAKKTNVGNLTTAITSFGQSSVQKLMERVVGQKINSVAANQGNVLFARYAPDAAKETMGFTSKSIQNVVLESLGIYNITHRYEDSQFNKAGRVALNLSSKMHELGNFGVIPRAVWSVISDYRYVDGKILSYSKFKQKNSDKEWTSYPLFSEDFIGAVKDGVLDFKNPEFLEKVGKKINMQGEQLGKYLDEKKIDISIRALDLVKSIDSQIPSQQRAVAQRDARANFFLSHISWFLIAKENKFGSRYYSYANEAWMEGNWRTTYNFLGKLATNPKGFKEIYSELDENQKKNLKRTLVELGFANALALFAMALANWVDDDDDPNLLLALSDMFVSRVAVEQISSTVGFPTSLTGTLDRPFMLYSKMGDWAKVNQLFDEEKRMKYLGNLVPVVKDVERFADPTKYTQTYRFFNEEKKDLYDNYAWLSNIIDEE